MAKTYLYPENLKAKSNLWLWSLQDFLILAVMMLVSVLALAGLGLLFPAAITLCFGFLTIRMGDRGCPWHYWEYRRGRVP